MRVFSLLILSLVLIGDFFYLSQQKGSLALKKAPITYEGSEEDRVKIKYLLQKYPSSELAKMLEAGQKVLEWSRVLQKTNSTIVSEIIERKSTIQETQHYPEGDVMDPENNSQYYYHIHSPHVNGHFHLFYRPNKDLQPILRSDDSVLFAHLIGISIDKFGQPVGLFTTNQWVTNESLFNLEDLEKMIDQFRIDHAYPSWATNQWLGAMVQLFRCQIIDLIVERNKAIEKHQNRNPTINAYEDRNLEITSRRQISVEMQIEVIQDILRERDLNYSEKMTSLVSVDRDNLGDLHLSYIHDKSGLYPHHPSAHL